MDGNMLTQSQYIYRPSDHGTFDVFRIQYKQDFTRVMANYTEVWDYQGTFPDERSARDFIKVLG